MIVKRKDSSGAPCMPYFDTVSSLLQSVDSHDLWACLAVGTPRRAQGRGSSVERRFAVHPHSSV